MPLHKAGQYTAARTGNHRLEWPLLRGLRPQRIELGGVRPQAVRLDRGPDLGHQALIKIQVMHRVQMRSQNLAALVEVAQVAATVVLAGIALAGFLDRAQVLLMRRITDVDPARPGE